MVSRFITNKNGQRFEVLLSEQDVELFDIPKWYMSSKQEEDFIC